MLALEVKLSARMPYRRIVAMMREHQGRWCYGKTPMRTFLDSLELAREKLIPH
ncbi:hypothetical protein [Paraburkholderia sp. HP33-1]|uniref:hypothetical protein n=1 Tax=Paraburkholderia sp. HP33-1 TaxID=2883243 RepID=UPI001F456888|nr:hypothetical protein [Paraburkholderia sp. HP33-1]